MQKEFVTCTTCGKEIKKPEGGCASVECIICGAVNVVEDHMEPSAGPQKLRLSTNAAANPSFKMCSSCEAPLEPDAAVCSQCGQAVQACGQQDADPVKSPRDPKPGVVLPVPVVLIGAVCILLAVTCVVLAVMLFRARAESTPSSHPGSAQVVPVDEEEAPVEAAPAEVVVPLSPRQLVEQQVRDDLNRDYPMFVQGQSVALQRRGGIITRGTVEALTPRTIVLLDDLKHPQEVKYSELGNSDRLRCDASYREQKAQEVLTKRLRSRGLE